MGVVIRGLDEWLADLDTLDERAEKTFRRVVKDSAGAIRADWRKRWEAIRHVPTHIPHLPRGVGYDTRQDGTRFSAHIGVDSLNRQANLAHIIEDGTPTSPPHPAGQDSLDAQMPLFVNAVADAAVDLLDGR